MAARQIFQKYMVTILSGIPGTQIYLDNVKIQSQTLEKRNQRLTEVLHIATSKSPSECRKIDNLCKINGFFWAQSIHRWNPLENKTTAIKNMKALTNKRELQVFMGGINFYAKFIKNRATIAEPLHRLLDVDAE